ncbi:MAG: hypothetical protein JWR24_2120 [Actinoallomurus sp.]|nr:hypothetical protein [Actinoallomurus sp.]
MYPQPGPYAPPPARKRSGLKGCLIVVAAVFVGIVILGAVGAAIGGGTSAKSPVATPAETQSAAAGPAKKPVNGVGREYHDGKFAFTVTKIKKGVRQVGDQYVGKTAQGQFVLVYVTVANIGDQARTFDSGSQKLKDAEGREFSADTEATIAMGNESKAFLEDINPGNGVHGILVFDVPKGIKLKSLELHDSPFSGGVTVPLGS